MVDSFADSSNWLVDSNYYSAMTSFDVGNTIDVRSNSMSHYCSKWTTHCDDCWRNGRSLVSCCCSNSDNFRRPTLVAVAGSEDYIQPNHFDSVDCNCSSNADNYCLESSYSNVDCCSSLPNNSMA